MRIHHDHLSAIKAIKKHGSFTLAAQSVGITQPALTKRIQALESLLENRVVSRGTSPISLTPYGQRLLHLADQYEKLEHDFFEEMSDNQTQGLSGIVHIGASSSHLGPVLIPSLAKLARENPNVNFYFEMDNIESLFLKLQKMTINFILSDRKFSSGKHFEYIKVWEESFVMIHPKSKCNTNRFLGTVESDPIHGLFMDAQPKHLRLDFKERSFMGTGQALIDSVANGYGSSIVPLHLVEKQDRRIYIDKTFAKLRIPIYLTYLHQPVLSKLEKAIITSIEDWGANYIC